MDLNQDEVIQILKLIEESNFDELHLEVGGLKLVVRKQGSISGIQGQSAAAEGGQEAKSVPQKIEFEATALLEEGLLPIRAPMLGTFYKRPEPGAPPYVGVGTFVKEHDTVCLIEVMKVFSAVKAGVKGYIDKILAESGQLVEYGQILFLVRPGESPEESV